MSIAKPIGASRPLTKCKHASFFKKHNSKIKMNEVIRCYECDNGHQYAEIVKKTDEICQFQCPECREPLYAIIMGSPICVIRDKEPTTIGQCAERNSRRLSKYKMSEEKAIKESALKEKRKSWHNPEGKDLSFLNKMSDREKMSYIETGDTNGK